MRSQESLMTDIHDDGDDELGEDRLGDYETGFVDAVLYLQGIEHPTEKQFSDALRILERFMQPHEASSKPS
jgi:hypothetical protein